jgi:hypothetical protein
VLDALPFFIQEFLDRRIALQRLYQLENQVTHTTLGVSQV